MPNDKLMYSGICARCNRRAAVDAHTGFCDRCAQAIRDLSLPEWKLRWPGYKTACD